MIWNEETIGTLRRLWSDGLSTSEIGRRLHVSKNAIVGKARRLGLDSLKSHFGPRSAEKCALVEQLLRNGMSVKAVSKRAQVDHHYVRETRNDLGIPPRGSARGYPQRTMDDVREPRLLDDPMEDDDMPLVELMLRAAAPLPAQSARIIQFVARNPTACCFPIGEVRDPGFRFCDEPSIPSKPYCKIHDALCHGTIRHRRDAA